MLVGRYSPPAVVVDSDFQIVHTRGKTGPYLELASGDPSLDLLKMAREGLLHALRGALNEARRTLKPSRRDGVLVRVNGGTQQVNLQVLPVSDSSDPHFLVLFEPPLRVRPSANKPPAAGKRRPVKNHRIERMREELTTSRDYMQSIIQDLEAANEELQSANEEILSSNEELQSTNEELDTAKEELQSTNEELNTVNDELNARNDELSYLNSDLVNMLASVPAAIVIVTSDLRIRRFTPMAEHVLNLIPTDVSRPIGDIKPNIDAPDLEELTREVIDTLTIKELEARDRSGRRYLVRIRPYKNQENRIDGAVLTFSDLEGSRHHESPQAMRELGQALANAVSAGLMILGDDLKVQVVNHALLTVIGASASSVQGRALQELHQRQWDNPLLMTALERLRTSGEPFNGVTLELSQSETRKLSIDGRRLSGNPSWLPIIIPTVREAPLESFPGAL